MEDLENKYEWYDYFKQISAGELRWMHGRQCKLFTDEWEFIDDGIISVKEDWPVYVAHNNEKVDWLVPDEKFGKEYGIFLYGVLDKDNHIGNYTYQHIRIKQEDHIPEANKKVDDYIKFEKRYGRSYSPEYENTELFFEIVDQTIQHCIYIHRNHYPYDLVQDENWERKIKTEHYTIRFDEDEPRTAVNTRKEKREKKWFFTQENREMRSVKDRPHFHAIKEIQC